MYLAVGDTSLADSINLLDGTNYLVLAGTFDPDSIHMTRKDVNALKDVPAKQELVQADGLRRIRMELQISGSSSDVLMANIRAIYKKQRQARDAGGAAGIGAGVCLWYKYGQASNWTYYDVVNMLAQPHDNAGGLDGLHYGMTLDLYCLPNPHGDAITTAATPTLVNGAPGFYYFPGIAGDVDAVCQVLLTDVSTSGKVINRVRLARRSLAQAWSVDFVPVLDAAILGSATSVADAACIGGARAHLVMAAGAAWANHAKVVPGSAVDNRGLFDVWARVRDTEVIAVPASTPAVSTNTAGGTLPGGAYQYAVVGVDSNGVETLPSALSALVTTTGPFFQDGFETNDFSLWGTIITTGTGTAAVNTTNPAVGTHRAAFVAGGTGNSAYVQNPLNNLAAKGILSVQFRFEASLGNVATEILHCIELLAGTSPIWYIQPTAGGSLAIVRCVNRDGTFFDFTNFTPQTTASGLYDTMEVVYDTTGGSPVFKWYKNNVLQATHTDATVGTTLVPTLLRVGIRNIGTLAGNVGANYDQILVANKFIGTGTIAAQNVLAWTAGAGAADHHVYWQYNAGSWQYLATGSATGAYTHTTVAGALSANPPVTSPYGVQLRMAGFIAGSGQQPVFSAPTQTLLALANGWHHLYIGTLMLPPVAVQEGQSAPLWELDIQSRPATATNAPTLDIDAVWLLPADEPQLVAEVPGLALAAAQVWRIDTRRDGRSSAVLEQPAGTVQGNLAVTGQFTVGPGDSFVVAMVDVAGGVSDVVDAKYQLILRIVPRYAFLRGLV